MSEKALRTKSRSESDRPADLDCSKTLIFAGQEYIDTSDDSSSNDIKVTDEHLVSFVAADLQEKIRMSSPTSSVDRASSITTTSNDPSPYPPLLPDAQVLIDLETHARNVSVELDQVLKEFKGSMHGISDLTVECIQTYNSSISHTCDQVDSSIKSMYQLLAKAEELTQVLRPVPRLAQQIKEIKRVLDLFESHLQKSIG